jgi:excisionase family DNA binding protein
MENGGDSMERKLITLREASETLQVSRDTLRRLANRGELRTVRVARRQMVPTSEVDRIVADGIGKHARLHAEAIE